MARSCPTLVIVTAIALHFALVTATAEVWASAVLALGFVFAGAAAALAPTRSKLVAAAAATVGVSGAVLLMLADAVSAWRADTLIGPGR